MSKTEAQAMIEKLAARDDHVNQAVDDILEVCSRKSTCTPRMRDDLYNVVFNILNDVWRAYDDLGLA